MSFNFPPDKALHEKAATKLRKMLRQKSFMERWQVRLLNPDLNPTHHAAKVVKRGMKGFGHEGAVLFKANGKYYHGAVDDYEGRYSSCVAIADNIWGPYTNWHETVSCGGGTNFFQDKEGNW